jgi:hypothetical protein
VDFTASSLASEFPLVATAQFWEVLLRPRQALFIPRWCWHLVVAVSEQEARRWDEEVAGRYCEKGDDHGTDQHCLSVSFWWGPRIEKQHL